MNAGSGLETATRNTLDLSAIPVLNRKRICRWLWIHRIPGNYHYVAPMSFAAIAAGADGLVGDHPDPEHASSDGPQSLKPENFTAMMAKARLFAGAAERGL